MENLIHIFFLVLFVLLIYNYSLYYFKYHKDKQKHYISYNLDKKDKGKDKDKKDQIDENDGKNKDEKDQIDENDGKKTSTTVKDNCENNQCKNNSMCIPTNEGYECKCVSSSGIDPDGTPFSNRSFSGKYCEFQNDKSLGVQVILDDSKMKSQIVYNRKSLFDTQNFQWNDYI